MKFYGPQFIKKTPQSWGLFSLLLLQLEIRLHLHEKVTFRNQSVSNHLTLGSKIAFKVADLRLIFEFSPTSLINLLIYSGA